MMYIQNYKKSFFYYIALGLMASCITLQTKPHQNHYNKQYWSYQRTIGEAGGILSKFLFEDFIHPQDIVIDMGCGGGFLLQNIDCKRKIGFEINPDAIKCAKDLGIEVYNDLNKIEENIADVIISNHALEHMPNPFETLRTAKSKLRRNGLLIIVVPSEQANNPNYNYNSHDINQHLFTWTPMTLANLIKLVGFKIVKAEAIRHCWVGNYTQEAQKNDLTEYHKKCRQHALDTNNYQVKVVAQKID